MYVSLYVYYRGLNSNTTNEYIMQEGTWTADKEAGDRTW